MNHIVLFGDSVFDNASYTRGEPDVITHLRSMLPRGASATLLAVDGAMTVDLANQTSRVPHGATHVVVSIGGNDVLMNSDLLRMDVSSSAEALSFFADRAADFERTYRAAIAHVLALGLDTTICTVYNGNLEGDQAPLARVALTPFDDVIIRVGVEHRLKVIELRLVCTEPADYANPIEPSGRGGRKIAEAIMRATSMPNVAKYAAVIIGR